MSRIGKQPIALPSGVDVKYDGAAITITGPKGSLNRTLRPEVLIAVEEKNLVVKPRIQGRETPAFWGLTRALLAGMVQGVSQGF